MGLNGAFGRELQIAHKNRFHTNILRTWRALFLLAAGVVCSLLAADAVCSLLAADAVCSLLAADVVCSLWQSGVVWGGRVVQCGPGNDCACIITTLCLIFGLNSVGIPVNDRGMNNDRGSVYIAINIKPIMNHSNSESFVSQLFS